MEEFYPRSKFNHLRKSEIYKKFAKMTNTLNRYSNVFLNAYINRLAHALFLKFA